MTDKELCDLLRDSDSYYRVQEKHWCIDGEELERQRLSAADRIEALTAENEKLIQQLVDAEHNPYCEICGSCGEAGCGCTHKCKFAFDHPDVEARIEALNAEVEFHKERADALALQSDEWEGKYAIACDRIEALNAEVARLRDLVVAERQENLWNAYATGDVRGDEWTHLFMSDGEWLAKECGFDPKQGYYSAEAIRNAIPIAARAALGDEA